MCGVVDVIHPAFKMIVGVISSFLLWVKKEVRTPSFNYLKNVINTILYDK